MEYSKKIRALTQLIPSQIIDFSQNRDEVRTPTQATSNFITNKEQGDWAEDLIFRAINQNSKHYVAVKYGKSDNIIAGEEDFNKFFKDFQSELDLIGKRPDLLIFAISDFDLSLGYDISQIPHHEINEYIKKAKAGIEVRSSAFLIDKYEETMRLRTQKFSAIALSTRNKILAEYSDVISHASRNNYINILNNINEETLSIIDFRVPSWSSSSRLMEVKELFKKLKHSINEVQKRDYLSITPKVEDIKIVYKWIEAFNIPHFYFQVFFDKIYGISFEQILTIISDTENEGSIFSVESDSKNQNKTTIKINVKAGTLIAERIDEPSHSSVRKEMSRGRLLYYVTYKEGRAYMDIDQLKQLMNINDEIF